MVTDTIIYKSHIKSQLMDSIVFNENLSKKDLRVIIFLFTKLGGYCINNDISLADNRTVDPNNYSYVDVESIAKALNMSKKDVKKSIKNLVKEYILDEGQSNTVKHGYRFTF